MLAQVTRAKKKVILLASNAVLHPPLAVCENSTRQDGLRLLSSIEHHCKLPSANGCVCITYQYSSQAAQNGPRSYFEEAAQSESPACRPCGRSAADSSAPMGLQRQGSSIGTHLSHDESGSEEDSDEEGGTDEQNDVHMEGTRSGVKRTHGEID